MDGLFNSSLPSKEEISVIIAELSSLTKPKKYDAVMAGNIKIATQILQDVVNFNKQFSNSREVVSSNVEASISKILDWPGKLDLAFNNKILTPFTIATHPVSFIDEAW